MDHQIRRGSGRFDNGAVRAQVAAQDSQTPAFGQWIIERADDFPVVTFGFCTIFSDCFPVDGRGILVDQVVQLTDHRGQAAGIVKIFHQIFA